MDDYTFLVGINSIKESRDDREDDYNDYSGNYKEVHVLGQRGC